MTPRNGLGHIIIIESTDDVGANGGSVIGVPSTTHSNVRRSIMSNRQIVEEEHDEAEIGTVPAPGLVPCQIDEAQTEDEYATTRKEPDQIKFRTDSYEYADAIAEMGGLSVVNEHSYASSIEVEAGKDGRTSPYTNKGNALWSNYIIRAPCQHASGFSSSDTSKATCENCQVNGRGHVEEWSGGPAALDKRDYTTDTLLHVNEGNALWNS